MAKILFRELGGMYLRIDGDDVIELDKNVPSMSENALGKFYLQQKGIKEITKYNFWKLYYKTLNHFTNLSRKP